MITSRRPAGSLGKAAVEGAHAFVFDFVTLMCLCVRVRACACVHVHMCVSVHEAQACFWCKGVI